MVIIFSTNLLFERTQLKAGWFGLVGVINLGRATVCKSESPVLLLCRADSMADSG